jgi:hypothetical protein
MLLRQMELPMRLHSATLNSPRFEHENSPEWPVHFGSVYSRESQQLSLVEL